MTTQQLYQKVLNEQMTQKEFLWTVRRDTVVNDMLTNTMSFEDTVSVLKAKGFISESNEESQVKSYDFLGTFKSLLEAKTNKLKGGKGDKLTADHVNYYEFTKGWKHELEHTDDIDTAKEIALDHLAEDPNYYTRLDMIEYQAKKEKKKEKPQEPTKGNLKDKDNQMTSPKGIEKFKKNVTDKKEKAKKVTGIKTMKGGPEAPKVIKEEDNVKNIGWDPVRKVSNTDMKYDPNQVYMYKKVGLAPKAEKMSSSAFYKLLDDSEVTDLEKYTPDGFEKLKAKKDNIIGRANTDNIKPVQAPGSKRKKPRHTAYQKYAAKSNAEIEKTKGKKQEYIVNSGPDKHLGKKSYYVDDALAYLHAYGQQSLSLASKDSTSGKPKAAKGQTHPYDIKKGPGAGSKYPVLKTDAEVADWKTKYGNDSIIPNEKVSGRYKTTTPGKANVPPVSTDKPRFSNTPDVSTKGTRKVVEPKSAEEKNAYYVINKDAKTKDELDLQKFDTMALARDAAKELNKSTGVDKYRPIPGILLNKYTNDLKEELEKADIKKVKDKEVGFQVSAGKDPDAEANVLNKVSSVSFNENTKHLTISFKNGGSLDVFKKRNSEELASTYTDSDGKTTRVLDLGGDLTKLATKAFAKADPKQTEEEPDQAVEAYVRKRIREALNNVKKKLSESEVGQYIGFQGPDVKRKNLNDIMKRYEWGYQDSDDPYVRDRGSEDNKTVAQFVGELGKEGVKIFNSYAPKGYEIKSVEDLGGYMKGTRGGMPQDRAFNPDALDQRSGRVAEDATADDDKKILDLAKAAMGSGLNSRAEDVAKILGSYVSKHPNADQTIVRAFHKMADKTKK